MSLKPYIKNANTLVSSAERYTAQVRERIRRVNEASLDRSYQMAQSLVPVETGETKRSMKHEMDADGMGYKMGFDPRDRGPVPWFLEFGTRFMPARPMIHPTREAEAPRLRADWIKAAKG